VIVGENAKALAALLAPADSPLGADPPLSVLAVELLPSGTTLEKFSGQQLASRRILRVSPIPRAC
jgi:hypothetical protein